MTSKGNYCINLHCHRLAAWAASRAYSRGLKGASAEATFALLNRARINEKLAVRSLGRSEEEFDRNHNMLCKRLIRLSKPKISYGRAAKLLNAYLKVRFVCGPDHKAPIVRAIHPPVDRLLLLGLADIEVDHQRRRFWRNYAQLGWSNFEEEDYARVIQTMRTHMGGKPLWTIEEQWRGFRPKTKQGRN